MKISKSNLTLFRLFFGLLGFSAIVTEIAVLTDRAIFKPENFFSFFTIQSNIIVVITLMLTVLGSKFVSAKTLAKLRGAATTYILIVGIGFAVLLSGLEDTVFTVVPWDNIVLHYIMPAVMLIDWLADKPASKLKFKRCLTWLLYPLLYVAYSLYRGNLVDWYPYPFLDPAVSSPEHIAITVAGLLTLGAGIIFALIKIARKK